MTDTKRYDVFISYRRVVGREYARLLYLAFERQGLKCFFDFNSIRHGKFNSAIFRAIEEAPVFVLVMPDGTFVGCEDEEDWVRMESCHALKFEKEIVPVVPSGSARTFPSNLPACLLPLQEYQISQLYLDDMFDASVDLIVRERIRKGDLLSSAGSVVSLGGLAVMPKGNPRFVGREDELKQLHGLCMSGRIPLIHAAGGTGKTELAIEYGRRHVSDTYKGGVFYVPMEGIGNWADALCRLHQNNLAFFQRPSIEAGGTGMLANEHPSPEQIRTRLLQLVAKQHFLLILDNVDGDCLGLLHDDNVERGLAALFDGDIPAYCHLIVTSRVADGFSPAEMTILFPLENLLPESALQLMEKIAPASSEEERGAARRIADLLQCHAWSIELAASDVARNNRSGRRFRLTYEKKLESLREKLSPAGDMGVAYRNAVRTPEELFQPTIDSLCAQEHNGKELLKLAQIVALFSADGVAWHVLRHLWTVLFVDKGEFAEAVAVLRDYGVLKFAGNPFEKAEEDAEPVVMHRFSLTALLKSIVDFSHMAAEIGVAAKGYDGFGRKECMSLIGQPAVFKECPVDRLTGKDWVVVLAEDPQFADVCCWETLTGCDWRSLLEIQPALADRCDWDKMTCYDRDGLMFRLFLANPQLVDERMWNALSQHQQILLLTAQPEFADRWADWNALDGADWARLLAKHVEFADRCDWEKLDGSDWVVLLSAQPQFEKHCNWVKLNIVKWWRHEPGGEWEEKTDYDTPTGEYWRNLLIVQPQFEIHCPFDLLNGESWAKLLSVQPQLARCCDWAKLDGGDWAKLLSSQPNLAEYCDWSKLTGRDWSELLSVQPHFEDRGNWARCLTSVDWVRLLQKQSKFADCCPWERLGEEEWLELLSVHSEYADRCNLNFDKLDVLVVWNFLHLCPALIDRCKKLRINEVLLRDPKMHNRILQFFEKIDKSDLSESDWAYLLSRYPQLSSQYEGWAFTGWEWVMLLSRQPQFSKFCDWNLLDGAGWAKLLQHQPQFSMRCRWELLSGSQCAELFSVVPSLIQNVDACKFTGDDWATMIIRQPQLARIGGLEKLNGENWSDLLSDQPQFSSKCNWDKFEGKDWAHLLITQPQFADKCRWQLVGEEDLRNLLLAQPQFVEQCDLSKLRGCDWSELLWQSRYFSDKCNWEMLQAGDWVNLLGHDPFYSDKCDWRKLAEGISEEERWGLLYLRPQFREKLVPGTPVRKPSGVLTRLVQRICRRGKS